MSTIKNGQRESFGRRRLIAGVAAAAISLTGLIMPVDQALAATDVPKPAAHYDMSVRNGKLADISNNHHDGTIRGLDQKDFTSEGSYHFLTTKDGDNSKYVELPAGILNQDNDFAVEMTLRSSTPQATAAWTIGRGDGPWNTKQLGNYVFMAPCSNQGGYRNQILAAIRVKKDDQNDESRMPSGGTLSSDGSFSTVTLSSKDNTLTLYVNGAQRATLTHSFSLKDIVHTSGVLGYIGHSLYDSDQGFIGSIADMKIYDTSLTAEQVKASEPPEATRHAMTIALGKEERLSQTDVFKATLQDNSSADDVTSDLIFSRNIENHSFTWDVPENTVVTSTGVVTRPMNSSQTVTVKATDTSTGTTYHLVYRFPAITSTDLQNDLDKIINNLNKQTTENLPLLATGTNNAKITWASSDPSIITPTNKAYTNPHPGIAADDPYRGAGKVTRPAYGRGDSKPVTLTATETLGRKAVHKSVVVTVKEKARQAPNTGYASVTFRDDHTAGQRLWESATSTTQDDFFSFRQINHGNPVIISDGDTGGLRDPFVLRSHDGDKYYMLATDLDVDKQGWNQNQQYGSLKMEVWESTDLVNWTRTNAPANTGITVNAKNQGMTWAPEAFWDNDLDSYVVFFSSRRYTDNTRETPQVSTITHNPYNHVRMAITRDFKTFTPTTAWQDTQYSRIDSDVFKIGDYYYRLTKNEENGAAGPYITTGKSTFLERSKILTSKTTTADPNANPNKTWQLLDQHILPFEGPESIKLNKGDVNQNEQGDAMVIMSDSGGYQPYMTSEHQLAADSWSHKLSLTPGWHTQKPRTKGVTGYVDATGMPTPKRHGAFVAVPANILSNMHRWTANNPTKPDPVSTTTTITSRDDRTYTATVKASDNGEIAGIVHFAARRADGTEWAKDVKISHNGTATVILPDWSNSATLTATYTGYDNDASVSASPTSQGISVPAANPVVPVSPSVDRSGLVEAVSDAGKVDRGLYTPASLRALDSALSAARAVLSDSSASQSDVDAALAALRSAVSGLVARPVPSFRDVPAGAWYASPVARAASLGLMTGYDRFSFGPLDRVTREQAAVVFYRAAGSPAVSGRLSYRDARRVSPWARDAVLWASRSRVMNGYGRLNVFGPQDSLTRAQAAAVLARASGSDIRDLRSAMRWAVSRHVINGWPDRRRLDPDGRVDRAQLAQILVNAVREGVRKESSNKRNNRIHSE